MIRKTPDHGSMSGPTLPAEIDPDAADPKRREFFKSLGERAKYIAPTLTILTFSRRSLAQEISEPPPLPEDYPISQNDSSFWER